MRLYTFVYYPQWGYYVMQVIAENEERAVKLLQDDGHHITKDHLETVYPLMGDFAESITFLLDIENPNYEG